MEYVGIDIGSTASKAVIINENKDAVLERIVVPSGWNSKETAEKLLTWVREHTNDFFIVATGYGRVSVDFADKVVTEITCHAKGVHFLSGKDLTVIDIGGQDTKIILQEDGKVTDFIMNDKCSAGTGKFLEVMANRLGFSLDEMFKAAERGKDITLSSTCTVFAESEVISLMGKGTPREDIARGVINQITSKTIALANRKSSASEYFLSGGFCENLLIMSELETKLKRKVHSHKLGRFAGAIGASLLAN